jgi:hypothetical protein
LAATSNGLRSEASSFRSDLHHNVEVRCFVPPDDLTQHLVLELRFVCGGSSLAATDFLLYSAFDGRFERAV